MICQKCHKEKEDVKEYHFYFGEKVKNTFLTNGKQKYRIIGEESGWICRGCIRKARISNSLILWVIGIPFLMFGIVLLSSNFAGEIAHEEIGGLRSRARMEVLDWVFVLGPILIGLLLCWFGVRYVRGKEDQDTGETVAIKARAREIESKYDFPLIFLTTAQYKNPALRP